MRLHPHPRRSASSDGGYVMVPVIAMLVFALGLGIALLALVDTQTSEGRTQRLADSAQTLAEGVATAAANVLAADQSPTTWPTTGACQQVTGNLTTPSAAAATSLAARVTTEVQARFAGTSSDYTGTTRATTWKVDVCPVLGTSNGNGTWSQSEARWSDAFLTRTITSQPGGTPPSRTSMWVRGQAAVLANGTKTRSKAVASKIQQDSIAFTPPLGYAVGTGSFTTDVSGGLNSVLSNNSSLVGGLLATAVGQTTPLISGSNDKIGVRCGLLSVLSKPDSICLSGTLAGAAQVTKAAGLGALNTTLGIARFESLPTWSMAPADAIAAWRTEAQTTGVYRATVSGSGSVTARTAPTDNPLCLQSTDVTTARVVYIGQVGTGEQYCTLNGAVNQDAAKIFIVEKGGVRITGTFRGLVYALNKKECTGTDDACSADDRTNATTREVVRIEGNGGAVVGQVWADGAGGAVGIYPTYSPSVTGLVDAIGGASGICGATGLTSVLSGLTNTLTTILNSVGNIISGRQTRPLSGTACDLLKAELRLKSAATLQALYQNGGTVDVAVSEHRNCTLIVLCGGAYTTGPKPVDYQTVSIPPLLTGDATLLGQLVSVLDSTVASVTSPATHYSAITYDATAVTNATAHPTTGAGVVRGSYRNVTPN